MLEQTPAPNDRPTQTQLTIAEALQLLERDRLTPEQLQAIAQTLHEQWG